MSLFSSLPHSSRFLGRRLCTIFFGVFMYTVCFEQAINFFVVVLRCSIYLFVRTLREDSKRRITEKKKLFATKISIAFRTLSRLERVNWRGAPQWYSLIFFHAVVRWPFDFSTTSRSKKFQYPCLCESWSYVSQT